MIPLRDRNPTVHTPWVTWLLIALNVAVSVYQFLLIPEAQSELLLAQHGATPAVLMTGNLLAFSTVLTSMFMHGNWWHLLSNIWFLHIFGDNVEDAFGARRFLFFYLICGIVAVFAHVTVAPTSDIPLVGASGAISGVLGAYVLLYPQARITTLIPIFIIFLVRQLPAWIFILPWLGIQLFAGLLSDPDEAGVAFFAHVGGFVAGLVLKLLMGATPPRRPRPWAQERPASYHPR